MEAISDNDAMIKPNPTNVHRYDHTIPASPPFSSPCVLDLDHLVLVGCWQGPSALT